MKTKQSTLHGCFKYAVFLVSSMVYADSGVEIATATAKIAVEQTTENPILSIVAGDWNQDSLMDSAVLVKSGEQVDLYLYMSNATGVMELKQAKKNIAWSGALAGTLPYLKVVKNKNLFIFSENDAVGRNRWHQHLNVDYRDNDFVVTGYTYDANDTLDPKFSLTCDVNLLTGEGIKNNQPFKIAAQNIKLSNWSDEKIPSQCLN